VKVKYILRHAGAIGTHDVTTTDVTCATRVHCGSIAHFASSFRRIFRRRRIADRRCLGIVEPLLEYRSLPTIEWLSVLPDGWIGDVWLRGESREQPSCAHKQAEGSGAAIGHNGMKC
jgi:hypothetical protein